MIVRLALNVPLLRHFDYLYTGDAPLARGVRVRVPFGNQQKIGIVLACVAQSDIAPEKLKPVIAVLDSAPLFDERMWDFLHWASRYYHAPLGEVLFSALPVKLRQGEPAKMAIVPQFTLTDAGRNALETASLQRAPKQAALLNELSPFHTFIKPPHTPSALWQGLLSKGLIAEQPPQPPAHWQQRLGEKSVVFAANCHALNAEQTASLHAILDAKGFQGFLLDGVTGSGKTEVYLQVMEAVLAHGQQVLVLVPEIGLTPQTIARFQARFAVEMRVLHSNLNDSARLACWLEAREAQIAIVLGTRSALFTPFDNLGLIILDEEHDSSFKQQEVWRYHARDLALLRAKQLNIPIILGSATPSFESLHNAKQGKLTRLALTQRAGNASAVKTHLIDLKTQRIQSGLSDKLLNAMEKCLARGDQVMLFLNRRGFAPVLLCHECGWVATCDSCDRPFTYHQKQHALRCHHCMRFHAVANQCGHCGSPYLITTGVGTEQLESVLQQRFPDYPIVRIDRDSTARKGALDAQLQQINAGGAQILIGTQMLAKGHHFPNVTLVGLVNIDSSLFSTDFRAEERLAQLFVQVAGRAGREEKAGVVLLQTHYPEHPLIKHLLTLDYNGFATQNLALREAVNLPPFSAQALIKASAKDENALKAWCEALFQRLRAEIQTHGWTGFHLLPPQPAPIARKAGLHRWQLVLQHAQRQGLQQLLNRFDEWRDELKTHGVNWVLDCDPMDFS